MVVVWVLDIDMWMARVTQVWLVVIRIVGRLGGSSLGGRHMYCGWPWCGW